MQKRVYPLSQIFSKNIANAHVHEYREFWLPELARLKEGTRRVGTVRIQDTRADGCWGHYEHHGGRDTFWSAVAISPKSSRVFYGRTVKRVPNGHGGEEQEKKRDSTIQRN